MTKQAELTHRAYTVVKREGQEDYWHPIGAAFEPRAGGLLKPSGRHVGSLNCVDRGSL